MHFWSHPSVVTSAGMCISMYVCVCVCACACMRMCAYVYVCVCVCVRVRVCVCRCPSPTPLPTVTTSPNLLFHWTKYHYVAASFPGFYSVQNLQYNILCEFHTASATLWKPRMRVEPGLTQKGMFPTQGLLTQEQLWNF